MSARAVNGYGCALSRLRFAGYGCALSRLRFAHRPCSRGIMPCNLSDIYRWRNYLPFQRAARIGQGGAPRSGVQNHE